ncbi:MAG: tRNA 4-thiouridine(8) synthase ThiI [Methanomassiliicoccales archaeon]|jgi:thiamine biosynthesis protein ThiI|nr:tRNA 4-thiouridine(8) synthase ThiI [Methanomassiliicoccales archaeon]
MGKEAMKAICLISGGIDSPVASFLIGRRGFEINLLHLDHQPFSDQRMTEKIRDIAQKLAELLEKNVRVYIAPHGKNQEIIADRCDPGYRCVLCKMLMLRVADGLGQRLNADAIVTGESLGQVASQTLHNIRVEQHGISLPVLRPLIGLDKLEIENIAKSIGTYEISIKKVLPCSFVPKRPATRASLNKALQEAQKAGLEEIARQAISEIRQLEF